MKYVNYVAKFSFFEGRGVSHKTVKFSAKNDFDALMFVTLKQDSFSGEITDEDKTDCKKMFLDYCESYGGIDPSIESLKAFSWDNSEEIVIDSLKDETGRTVYDSGMQEKKAKGLFELSDKDLAKLSDKYLEKLSKGLDRFSY